jgi:hypothetical protein
VGADWHWIGIMKNKFADKTSTSWQKGQDLLEFALIFPLLMLIVVGVLDLGRAFFAAIAVANVAREGARYGIDLDWDSACDPGCDFSGFYSSIESIAEAEASNLGLDPSKLDATANCGACLRDSPLEVIVTYDFQLILDFIISDFTIQRSTKMMIP